MAMLVQDQVCYFQSGAETGVCLIFMSDESVCSGHSKMLWSMCNAKQPPIPPPLGALSDARTPFLCLSHIDCQLSPDQAESTLERFIAAYVVCPRCTLPECDIHVGTSGSSGTLQVQCLYVVLLYPQASPFVDHASPCQLHCSEGTAMNVAITLGGQAAARGVNQRLINLLTMPPILR